MTSTIFRAFLRRDRLLQWSYRFDLALNGFSILFSVATFYYVSKIFGNSVSPAISAYGGDYFSFVLIGLAFSTYQRVGMQTVARRIREDQLQGTLEAVFAAPISPFTLFLASAQWDFVDATIQIAIYFCIAVLFFGLNLQGANLPAAILILLLTFSTFMALGMLSAACVLTFKRGDPVSWLIDAISELLGGVFFPIAVLPGWLREFSRWIPMTHALEGLRLSLLAHAPLSAVLPSACYLGAFTVVLFSLGSLLFKRAFQATLRCGSLAHY